MYAVLCGAMRGFAGLCFGCGVWFAFPGLPWFPARVLVPMAVAGRFASRVFGGCLCGLVMPGVVGAALGTHELYESPARKQG